MTLLHQVLRMVSGPNRSVSIRSKISQESTMIQQAPNPEINPDLNDWVVIRHNFQTGYVQRAKIVGIACGPHGIVFAAQGL